MPNPKDVHDPDLAPWVAVISSATTSAILGEGFDALDGLLLAADTARGLTPEQLRAAVGLDDPEPRRFVDLITVRPHPLMHVEVLGEGTTAQVARTRVPNGSCLVRVDPDGSRRVLTYYDGPAYGWRNGRGYAPPIEPLGPWARFAGAEYAAAFPAGETERVGLVAVSAGADGEPPEGFTWTKPGISQRYVALTDLDSLTTP